MKPRKPLREMGDRPAVTIAGKPADVCPYCGCVLFVDGVNRTDREVMRYVECRNASCRRRFVSYQTPAKLLREVGKDAD